MEPLSDKELAMLMTRLLRQREQRPGQLRKRRLNKANRRKNRRK